MKTQRRTWFSAPLVAVTASCSSSGPKPDPFASYDRIAKDGTACVVYEHVTCPKNATCNPPPPRAVECPVELGAATDAQLSAGPPGGDCTLVLSPCAELACSVRIKCPAESWDHPIAPLAWTIGPGSDGRCIATPRSRTRFDGGGPPIPIDCPPGGVIERAKPTAPCVTCPTSPCPMDAYQTLCPDVMKP